MSSMYGDSQYSQGSLELQSITNGMESTTSGLTSDVGNLGMCDESPTGSKRSHDETEHHQRHFSHISNAVGPVDTGPSNGSVGSVGSVNSVVKIKIKTKQHPNPETSTPSTPAASATPTTVGSRSQTPCISQDTITQSTYKYNWPTYRSDVSLAENWMKTRNWPKSKSGQVVDKTNRRRCMNATTYSGSRTNVNEDNLEEYINVLSQDYCLMNVHTIQETAPDPPNIRLEDSVGYPKVFFDIDEKAFIMWTNIVRDTPDEGLFSESLLDRFLGLFVKTVIAKFFPELNKTGVGVVQAIAMVSKPVCVDRNIERSARKYSSGVHIVFPKLFVNRSRQLVMRNTMQLFFKDKMPDCDWSKVIDLECRGAKSPGALKSERCDCSPAKRLTCSKCVFGNVFNNLGMYKFYKSFDGVGKVVDIYPDRMDVPTVASLFRQTTLTLGSDKESESFVMDPMAAAPDSSTSRSLINGKQKDNSQYLDAHTYPDIYKRVAEAIGDGRVPWQQLRVDKIVACGLSTVVGGQMAYESLLVSVSGKGSLACMQKFWLCKNAGMAPSPHESNHIYFRIEPFLLKQMCHDPDCKKSRPAANTRGRVFTFGYKAKQQLTARANVGMYELSDVHTNALFPFYEMVLRESREKYKNNGNYNNYSSPGPASPYTPSPQSSPLFSPGSTNTGQSQASSYGAVSANRMYLAKCAARSTSMAHVGALIKTKLQTPSPKPNDEMQTPKETHEEQDTDSVDLPDMSSK